jgi:hypothetical protein
MYGRRLTGLVAAMMWLGSSCSAEHEDASAADMVAGSGSASSSARGSEQGTSEGPNQAPIAADKDAGNGAAQSSAPGSKQGTLGDPNVRAKLRELALRASSATGVASPRTMVAVASPDHQAAEAVVSGAIINDHAAVYVIVVTGGRFTIDEAPPGQPFPHGDVLTLTVNAADYSVPDFGVANEEPDLSKISSVIVDLAAE